MEINLLNEFYISLNYCSQSNNVHFSLAKSDYLEINDQ